MAIFQAVKGERVARRATWLPGQVLVLASGEIGRCRQPSTGSRLLCSFSETDTHWAPNFGAGLMIRATDKLSIRLEFEKFSNLGDDQTTGEHDVTMFSAGVLVRF